MAFIYIPSPRASQANRIVGSLGASSLPDANQGVCTTMEANSFWGVSPFTPSCLLHVVKVQLQLLREGRALREVMNLNPRSLCPLPLRSAAPPPPRLAAGPQLVCHLVSINLAQLLV